MPKQVGGIELTDQEVEEFREVFELVDTDKGGTIESAEVMELMEMLGINTTQEQVDDLINDIDDDGNGEIDFEEFLEVMAAGQKKPYTKQEMNKAFNQFRKKNGDKPTPEGYIKPDELRQALKYTTLEISEKEFEELLATMETSKDGLIDYKALLNIHLGQGD